MRKEALDDLPLRKSYHNGRIYCWSIFARTQQMNVQLQVESLQKFHHSMMGQLPGSSMRSLLKIGFTLLQEHKMTA